MTKNVKVVEHSRCIININFFSPIPYVRVSVFAHFCIPRSSLEQQLVFAGCFIRDGCVDRRMANRIPIRKTEDTLSYYFYINNVRVEFSWIKISSS